MAIIYSYPQVKPKTTDLLIGTVTYDATGTYPVDGNPTRTFSVQDIANLAASYTLTTQQNGTSSTLTLKSDAGSLSVVNLFRGSGISLNSNGSNAITIGNLGVLSANAANTNFINMTPSSATTGNVTFSASLSASGSAGSSTYLRGDNTWATPVNTVSAASTTFIDLTPLSALNGDVQISAALSASGTPSASNFLRGDNVWAVPAGGGTITSVNAGTGIAVDNSNPADPIISNTGVIKIIGGTDISVTPVDGTGTVTINSTSQGGVTDIIAGNNISISPVSGLGSVTINALDTIYTAGNAINITNNVITNTAPDQVVSLIGTGAANVTGSYPDFTIDVTPGEDGVITKDSFTSNGTQVDYVLSQTPVSTTYIEVFISGVYQEDSTYTLTGDTVTLSNAADSGDTIEIVAFNLGAANGGGGGGGVDSLYAGTGISLTGSTGDITVTNTFPDKTVVLNAGGATTVTGTYPTFNISSTDTTYTAGADISVVGTVISNTAPDQTVVLTDGNGITTSGTYPNFTITNSLPDQIVSLTGSGSATISGTYPSFNVDTTDTTYTAGSGLSLVGTEFTNIAPDQTVVVTGSNAASVTGSYPNFNINAPSISAGTSVSLNDTDPNNIIINNTAPDQIVSLTASTGIEVTGAYPNFTITNTSDPAIVESVNGEIGVVVLDTDNISEGATNLYDKTVSITGGGATTVTGAYPNFSITSTDTNTQYTAGTGLTLIGQQFQNTAPDVLVTLTGAGGTTVTGSYPNFTVSSSTSGAGLDSVVAGASIGVDNTDPANPIITNTAPDQTVVITGTGGTTVTGSYPNFNIDSPSSGVSGITGSGTTSYLPLFSGATELSDSNVSFNGSVLSVASDANINGHTAGRGGNNISTNVVFGSGALPNNTTGDNNVAVGLTALANNSTGKYNVAVGTRALNTNTTSFQNTAIGFNALYLQSTGGKNTAIGSQALLATTGDLNIGIGVNAGQGTTTARSSISIGGDSWDGFNAAYNPAYNITTESNYISMGFGSTTNAYVNVAWTIVSDERDKTNFSDIPHGLEFVSKLKPISYQLKENRDSDKAVGDIKYGFKAQDILALEGNNPVIIDNKNEDKLRYNESNLIAVLVKSIQELEERIKTLETK
jgi:hypothetical protein